MSPIFLLAVDTLYFQVEGRPEPFRNVSYHGSS